MRDYRIDIPTRHVLKYLVLGSVCAYIFIHSDRKYEGSRAENTLLPRTASYTGALSPNSSSGITRKPAASCTYSKGLYHRDEPGNYVSESI